MRKLILAYRKLIAAYGEDRVADALLAKWLADPDADRQWLRLAMSVARAKMPEKPLPLPRRKVPPSRQRHMVALWHLVNGHRDAGIAEHMGITLYTARQYVKVAREQLGLVGAPRALLAAEALRRGIVP